MAAAPIDATPRSRRGQRRTDFELAEHHQRQALVLRNKGQKVMIDQVLRQHPEDITDVYALLANKGRLPRVHTPGAAVKAEGPASTGGTGSETEVEVKKESAGDSDNGDGGDGAGEGDSEIVDEEVAALIKVLGEQINDTYVRLGGRHGLPARAWKCLLACLDPISFNVRNQQAMIPKGKRDVCCDVASECCEFMTGCDESTALTGELRKTRMLVKFLRKGNEDNGSPAARLRLPPNWASDGWWIEVERDEYCVKIQQRGCPLVMEVFPEDLGMQVGEAFDQTVIVKNFSLRRASLQDSSGTKVFNLYAHYLKSQPADEVPESGVKAEPKTPQVKKPRMASPVKASSDLGSMPPPPPPARVQRRVTAKGPGKARVGSRQWSARLRA